MTKREFNKQRLAELISMIESLGDKVPENIQVSRRTELDKRKLLEGTSVETLNSNELGFITDYLKECMNSKLVDDIVIAVLPGKNRKAGVCKTEEADYATVRVITSEKTIFMEINKMHPITRRVGTEIEIKNTSWKRLEDIRGTRNRKANLINRILVTSALHYERLNRVKVYTKDEWTSIFNRIEAAELKTLTSKVKREGISLVDGALLRVPITNDDMLMSIFKFVYNKLKNETMKCVGAGALNDSTIISFEIEQGTLTFTFTPGECYMDISK